MFSNDALLSAGRDESVSFHEAGHAVVGHYHGLHPSHIYVGQTGGQVIFDDAGTDVLLDRAVLDRYVLMLLAGPSAEWRRTGTIVGATGDLAALTWLLQSARARGTRPEGARWRRATAEVVRHWSTIEAIGDELVHRSVPVDEPVIRDRYAYLGDSLRELTGARTLAIIEGVRRNAHPRRGYEGTA